MIFDSYGESQQKASKTRSLSILPASFHVRFNSKYMACSQTNIAKILIHMFSSFKRSLKHRREREPCRQPDLQDCPSHNSRSCSAAPYPPLPKFFKKFKSPAMIPFCPQNPRELCQQPSGLVSVRSRAFQAILASVKSHGTIPERLRGVETYSDADFFRCPLSPFTTRFD